MPGFIDCNANSALYPLTGTGSDVTSLDHMTQYTSPAVQKLHDEEYAAMLSQQVVVSNISVLEMFVIYTEFLTKVCQIR